jgi:hypothetical protein
MSCHKRRKATLNNWRKKISLVTLHRWSIATLTKESNQELESINLLNSVRFENYEKNDQRIENDFITGECDIITNESIIDIKTSWSLDTFPELPEDIDANQITNGKDVLT